MKVEKTAQIERFNENEHSTYTHELQLRSILNQNTDHIGNISFYFYKAKYTQQKRSKQFVEHEMNLYWARSRINFQFSDMKHLSMPICNSFNFGCASKHFVCIHFAYHWCVGWNFHHFTIAYAPTIESQYNIFCMVTKSFPLALFSHIPTAASLNGLFSIHFICFVPFDLLLLQIEKSQILGIQRVFDSFSDASRNGRSEIYRKKTRSGRSKNAAHTKMLSQFDVCYGIRSSEFEQIKTTKRTEWSIGCEQSE